MTITRLFALKSLKQQGYVPGQKTYMLNVKHFLIKQFHLENVDKKGEAALNKTANSFAYDTKKFYANENGYRWDDFLTKKKEWLSKELKNPVPIPPVPKAAPKKRPKWVLQQNLMSPKVVVGSMQRQPKSEVKTPLKH